MHPSNFMAIRFANGNYGAPGISLISFAHTASAHPRRTCAKHGTSLLDQRKEAGGGAGREID
jgi:hypothetical protein